jgi:hypothetical protein
MDGNVEIRQVGIAFFIQQDIVGLEVPLDRVKRQLSGLE